MTMGFQEFMLSIGFFVKRPDGQIEQDYGSKYSTETALKLWQEQKETAKRASVSLRK